MFEIRIEESDFNALKETIKSKIDFYFGLALSSRQNGREEKSKGYLGRVKTLEGLLERIEVSAKEV